MRDFMIQGGCPLGTGTGSGPRKVDAEFSQIATRERGVLSMARLGGRHQLRDGSQFFVVHGDGVRPRRRLLDPSASWCMGLDVLDAIATSPVKRTPSRRTLAARREDSIAWSAVSVVMANAPIEPTR